MERSWSSIAAMAIFAHSTRRSAGAFQMECARAIPRLIPDMAIDLGDDRALVARAAAGDEPAFRAIVERHESAIARTVTAMLGPGDEADDVGQETFVRLFR